MKKQDLKYGMFAKLRGDEYGIILKPDNDGNVIMDSVYDLFVLDENYNEDMYFNIHQEDSEELDIMKVFKSIENPENLDPYKISEIDGKCIWIRPNCETYYEMKIDEYMNENYPNLHYLSCSDGLSIAGYEFPNESYYHGESIANEIGHFIGNCNFEIECNESIDITFKKESI